jgi:hypothetical protein
MFVMERSEDLNLSVSIGDMEDSWKVTAWARNITEPKPTYNSHLDYDQETEVIVLSSKNFMTFGLRVSRFF